MRKTLQALAIAALATTGVAQAAITTTIDLFTTNQNGAFAVVDNVVDGNVRTSQVGNAGDASIFGGFRELIVEVKDNGGNTSRTASMDVFNGELSFSTSSQTKGTGIVRWDGASVGSDGAALSAINPIGLDNGSGGLFLGNVLSDVFQMDVIFSDAGFKFVLEAYTNANQWSKIEILSNAHPVPTTTLIPLAAFMDCFNAFPVPGVTVSCGGSGPVDFANVGALQAVIDPNGEFTSLDLTLGQVNVVPEPGALSLVALALLGAGVATRRRKV